MKLEGFYIEEDTNIQTKKQFKEWENIFTNHTSDRGVTYKIYKEL